MSSLPAAFPTAPLIPVAAPSFSSSTHAGTSLPRKRSALRRHVERTGAALLNQQCWLWGCDIRRKEGNLLVAHGFSRMRPPDGQDRSTQYTLHLQSGHAVRLWGSGIYFGDRTEGVFLNRFLFEPRHAAFAEADWQDPAVLKRSPRHWCHAWLAGMATWIAGYERWIAQTQASAYRATCLAAFSGSVSRPGTIAAEWSALAALLPG